MNYGIQYVCYLVQKKNDLNRKRRRFYSIARPSSPLKDTSNANDFVPTFALIKPKRKRRVPITKVYAKKMYRVTKQEMKAMTAEMRRARKEINARYVWSNHGAIRAVECGEGYYNYEMIARMSDMWEADAILLGENNE